jgi:hypothetical protein
MKLEVEEVQVIIATETRGASIVLMAGNLNW